MTNAAALNALEQFLQKRLSRSAPDRDLHGRSESHFPPMPPDAVAYVESTEEVQQVMRICAKHDCPVIGWGTGTSLEGHTSAPRGGVTVDFSNMSQVLQINPDDMDALVQPGLTREALDLELRHSGLFFSVDPGANASIGGMTATRASGTTTLRYGTMRDNVIGLQVVLADGRVIRTGTRARKTAAGYDLTALFVGSEGTLGLITEIGLRLHPRPEAISAGIVAFERMDQAVRAVVDTIQLSLPMARLEFVDAATAAAFNLYASAEMAEKPHLLFELHGSEQSVAEHAHSFGEICSAVGGEAFQWSSQTEERTALWTLRHNAYYAILASRPGARAIVTDICVPISQLAEAVEETRADIAASPITGPILGHVGDGNFHAILLIDPDNAAEHSAALRLSDRMVDRAMHLGGTATGEHGVGMGKLKFMDQEHGPAWGLMGDLKRQLDPQNILNPGKLVQQN
ncbi:MAG: FAD-linked oxidase C-terminal domain-containing protein [Paracoccaceae bacterium]|nr:FAD-linked oxidase C-terminal domain-containing protein [Paracoccaceae bacterium]